MITWILTPAILGAQTKTAYVFLPDKTRLELEIADTPEKKVMGLMFRKSLKPNSGMLFTYERDAFPTIWMKNCYISLDIIWLSSGGRIVYYYENAEPCSSDPCPTYGTLSKARYVIETNARTISEHSLSIGQVLKIIY